MAQRVTYRKYEGDDQYSYAVFLDKKLITSLTGLNLAQAKYYRDQVRATLDTRPEKR